ncbi:hypothetical protein KC19_10G070800 [Ceratodon purpureus]|uniref:Uncharacterized protein n=1 Tax=Ceratodon purpureus TaxID=3225 RepID=A0A8T0GL82_CERPU|nr:hypothetical protein KC19_10G070800 [Ceratodon purpureus]
MFTSSAHPKVLKIQLQTWPPSEMLTIRSPRWKQYPNPTVHFCTTFTSKHHVPSTHRRTNVSSLNNPRAVARPHGGPPGYKNMRSTRPHFTPRLCSRRTLQLSSTACEPLYFHTSNRSVGIIDTQRRNNVLCIHKRRKTVVHSEGRRAQQYIKVSLAIDKVRSRICRIPEAECHYSWSTMIPPLGRPGPVSRRTTF